MLAVVVRLLDDFEKEQLGEVFFGIGRHFLRSRCSLAR